jgi:hypothetical protein
VDLPATTNVEFNNVALSTILAEKQNAAIGFTTLTANTTAINLASFAGKQVVTITYNDGNNKTITLSEDLKDSRQYTLEFVNTHSTISILITLPGAALTSTAKVVPVPNLATVYVGVLWHNLRERWIYRYGDSLVEVA